MREPSRNVMTNEPHGSKVSLTADIRFKYCEILLNILLGIEPVYQGKFGALLGVYAAYKFIFR